MENTFTPLRPKRTSPCFDYSAGDVAVGGCKGLGEGKGTGGWSQTTDNGPDSPTTAKRRRMELWGFCTPSTVSSCSGSPSRGTTPDTTLDDSMLSTPSESPAGTLTREDRRDFKKRYKKDELWPAIESNYQYLMDDEIIETCKSTESDLSWDEDDVTVNTKVSFTEFMQQFKELTDWLSQIHLVSQRKATSRSEKYLNQAYHEELLQSSPRRKLFNDYAKQLLKRYPSLKEEINQRIHHLNGHWQTLQTVVLPQNGFQDVKTMLSDLELDLHCIRSWLTGVEGKLLALCIKSNWTVTDIEAKLKEHLVLQREIESQSKVISAVLKLSERLQSGDHVELDGELRSLRERHQSTAVKLERRWHNVWLSSLEWQCRLEEALAQLREFGKKPLHSSDPSLWLDFKHSTSFTDGFGSDDQVELPNGDEDERVTGESDQTDTCGGVCESSDDPNSSDVIPFYDEEYEKICDVEQPTDEDREVQQLSEEMHERNQSSKLTALNKSGANLIEFKSEMMDILDERCSTHFINKPKKRKSESRDIGYSSEGYSNDEQLDPYDLRKICWRRAPSWNGMEMHGERAGDDNKPGELVTMDTVVIRRRPASLPLDSSLHALTSDLSSANKESPWRHSITSAYDTSSNCGSDPEAVIISEDVGSSDANAKSSNCEAILNSPTADYYKMIMVDTDFSTDRNDTDEQLSSTDHGNSPKQHQENPSTVVKIPEEVLTDSAFQEYSSLNSFINNTYLGSVSEIVQSTHSVHRGSGHKDSLPHGAEDVESGMVVSGFVPGSKEPSCHFIQEKHQGEDEFSGLGVSNWKNLSPDRVRKPRRATKLNVGVANAVHDTDTSSPRSGTDSLVDSSCEASGEDTTDSEDSDEEFSTASDNDHRCSSAFTSFSTLVGSDRNLTDRHDPISNSANQSEIPRSASAYSNYDKASSRMRVKSRRTRRERPWSIVALSDLKNQMNSKEKPLFKSESAIDSMSNHHNEVYTSTPKASQNDAPSSDQVTKPFATFPRDKSRFHRPRYMRRTKSMEDPESKANSSGSTSKRKLSYEKSANPEPVDSDMSTSDQCSVSILISSPEVNRSFASEDLVSSMSLIRDLEHTMIYSTTSSGSDTDLAAYVTPKQSMSESGSESEDQINSTGSFSETAWDNYQDPLYPTASEAPTEEPLHWEPQDELEFEDEEFRMQDGIKLSAEVIAERSDKLRAKERKSSSYLQEEDSDSDLEDLHHVIQQSVEQLHVTDLSLKKQRSDPMGTGISLDPSKYAEHVLTCETNLKCLEEVFDLPVISGHEAHQIEVLMQQWTQLFGFANNRFQQSQQLCKTYGDLTKVKATVSEVVKDMITGSFDEVNQLEAASKQLQIKIEGLCRELDHMGTVRESVTVFSQQHPTVPMDQFKAKATHSSNLLEKTAKRCQGRLKELEGLLLKWRDFQETSKELSVILGKERKQLQLIEFQQSLQLELSAVDLHQTQQHLMDISSKLETYEVKLQHLRELKVELADISSDHAQRNMAASLASLGSELFALRHWCGESQAQLQEEQGEDKDLSAEAAARSDEGRSLSPILSKILKGAAPAVVLVALMYLAMPDAWEAFDVLGLTVSPELKYIRGPPPS